MRESVLRVCVTLSNLTLIKAYLWCKQMFEGSGIFQSPAPLCAEPTRRFRGSASPWLPKWHNLRGTKMPPLTPQILLIVAVHLGFAFKALSPLGRHSNADM